MWFIFLIDNLIFSLYLGFRSNLIQNMLVTSGRLYPIRLIRQISPCLRQNYLLFLSYQIKNNPLVAASNIAEKKLRNFEIEIEFLNWKLKLNFEIEENWKIEDNICTASLHTTLGIIAVFLVQNSLKCVLNLLFLILIS